MLEKREIGAGGGWTKAIFGNIPDNKARVSYFVVNNSVMFHIWFILLGE